MNTAEKLEMFRKAADIMDENDIDMPSHALFNGQWYRQIEGESYEKIDDPNVVILVKDIKP